MANSWIEYHDGIETLQPDEGMLIEEIVASMGRQHGKVFDRHRHAVRDAHAKVHGVLKGTLSVPADLPETLEQGIFQRGREYAVFARLSSAPGDIHPDSVRSLKGLALKVFGVDGARLPFSTEPGVNQDFLFANLPILPFGDVKSYLEMQRKLEESAQHEDAARSVIPDLASTASAALPPSASRTGLWKSSARRRIMSWARPFTPWRPCGSAGTWRSSALPRCRTPSRS